MKWLQNEDWTTGDRGTGEREKIQEEKMISYWESENY